MKTNERREAIAECVRRACSDANQGEWYAVTVYPDGHIVQRCGIGVVTYSEDEYFGRPGAEETIFVLDAIPDIDPDGEWKDPDSGELDEDGCIQDIIDTCLEDYERDLAEQEATDKMQRESDREGCWRNIFTGEPKELGPAQSFPLSEFRKYQEEAIAKLSTTEKRRQIVEVLESKGYPDQAKLAKSDTDENINTVWEGLHTAGYVPYERADVQ
jgi:hypothetical protein